MMRTTIGAVMALSIAAPAWAGATGDDSYSYATAEAAPLPYVETAPVYKPAPVYETYAPAEPAVTESYEYVTTPAPVYDIVDTEPLPVAPQQTKVCLACIAMVPIMLDEPIIEYVQVPGETVYVDRPVEVVREVEVVKEVPVEKIVHVPGPVQYVPVPVEVPAAAPKRVVAQDTLLRGGSATRFGSFEVRHCNCNKTSLVGGITIGGRTTGMKATGHVRAY